MSWNDGLEGVSLKIAQTDDNPLRVMAGPGTGKTFTLMRRVARLLTSGVEPSKILVVTFTRVAADDLKRELNKLGISGCNSIDARTLHSFCFELLYKRYVFEYLKRMPRPLITLFKSGIMKYEAEPLLNDINNKNNFGGKRECTKKLQAFEAAWARLQSDIPGWPTEQTDIEFQNILIDWLKFHKAMLIGELVPVSLLYLRNNPKTPELNTYEHVIVDEYQDLNKAEQELIDLLASNCSNVIVGDPDQSIYRFRFAHPDGIQEYNIKHPSTHDENLIECRRCPKKIVDLASYLIKQNHIEETESRLLPYQYNQDGFVNIIQWDSLKEETDGLTEYISFLLENDIYKPRDILVLTPRRLIGYGIRNQLKEKGIPSHSFYHEELLEDKNAQKAFCLLTLLNDNQDRVALRYWLGCESPSWLYNQYNKLKEYCEQNDSSPWDVMRAIQNDQFNIPQTNRLLNRFNELIDILTRIETLDGINLVKELFPDNISWAEPIKNIISLIDEPRLNKQTILDHLKLNITQPEIPSEGEFVKIMSLYKSKGLTSKVVIIAGCLQGLIPFYIRKADPVEQRKNIEEQRRLFYVAITRTKERLVISSATSLDRGVAHKMGAALSHGGDKNNGVTRPSEFLSELGPSSPDTKIGKDWLIDQMSGV